ncbi:MAG: hypothetical protein ABUT20_28190 [Bacteroidota bacterium]
MKKNIPITLKQKAACMLMLLALVWLTVSIPFVYESQKTFAKEKIAKSPTQTSANDDDSSSNPLNNTTEEKSSNNSSTTLSEEYLHQATEEANHFSTGIIALHVTHEDTYTAFHGELLCPPPNA